MKPSHQPRPSQPPKPAEPTNPTHIHLAPAAEQAFQAAITSLDHAGLWSPRITLDELTAHLTPALQAIVKQIQQLQPADYGVGTPHIGLESVPSDLVVVSGQTYTEAGVIKTLADRYVPSHVYQAFQKLNAAFTAAYPGRLLLIGSGYRSPAYQIVVFLKWLRTYEGDIAKTIRHASPPAYSQHCSATKTALDFQNLDGQPTGTDPEGFKDTPEYRFLTAHAEGFGFSESWPAHNSYGMRWEPWHWQYHGTDTLQ